MSLEERRQSTPPSATTPPNTAKKNTPNQFKHQQAATSLDHRDTSEHQKSSPATATIQSCQAAISNSTLISQQHTEVMAMHNFGPNSSQHEHQLKNHQTDSGSKSSTWHNNNNHSNNNINSKNESSPNTSNNDHVNDSQQSSVTNNLSDQRAPVSDNSKSQSSSRSTLNRYQAQQHQPQLQSQSQQYHGIFSPQIPAILHKQLASRVDQVIRTTLNDSPSYTPPSGRNETNAVNTTNVLTSTPSSNMPLQTSSSSLIFNTATGSMSNSSAQQNIMSHPQLNQGVNMMPGSVSGAPITSIHGSTLSNMSDNPISASSNNLLAKTSPSHSALAAAAALQSLTQSHVQRSQQQQMAHTQPPPYTGISNVGSVSKPQSNGNGSPMPQAAHGGSIHQMPKFNGPSMAHSDQHNNPSFAPEQTNIGSLNFSSRIQTSNTENSNLNSKITGPAGLSNIGWQEQIHGNNLLPRLPPLHGLNGPLPSFAPSSSQGSFGIMNPQLSGVPSSNNANNMIGSDSDTLLKLNSMKSSPRQNNPMQFRDEKSFPMNFPTLMSNKQNQSNNDTLRGPQTNLDPEAAVQRGIMLFAYNLITHTVPGKPPKMLVHLDDELKKAIHNGEFYSKFGHIATGILSNHVYVPEFSIIDYLRKDRFSPEELENIRRINGTLTMPDLYYLMELVRQRPSDKGPQELGKPLPYSDISHVNAGISNSNCHPDHLVMSSLHHNSPHKGGSFLSSSPNRSDLIGPQGIDRSRRSSQSPSDISRSQLGSNTSNLKFINAHNPPNNIHQQVPSMVGPHQFTHPLCHPNQQQPHTSPQANRSSPFQPPLSVGPSPTHPLARPPRSHSTIVGLNMASFNPPFTPISPQVRQPPAAHQSSSRPNLAGLDNYLTNPHTSPSSIPVTAHMSSKTPQTPKLQDSLPKPLAKGVQQVRAPFSTNKSMMSGHIDFQNSLGRFDLDSNHALAMQSRHQELADRETSKASSGNTYLPPNMLGPGGNQSDLGRHHEMLDGNPSAQMLMNHMLPGNYPINSRDPLNRSLSQGGVLHSGMPPPSIDHRQSTNDLSVRNMNTGQGQTPNESQMKQYNALMGQFTMAGRVGESSPNSANILSQIPPYMYPPGSQMLPVGEPMHVDTMQQVKQPQGHTNSPKLSNQRSIITGSGTASTRKSKKAKPSPPAGASESKVVTSDQGQQDVSNPSLSDSVDNSNITSLPSLSKYSSPGSGLATGTVVSPVLQDPDRPEPATNNDPCVSRNTSLECNSEIKNAQESCTRAPMKMEDTVAGDQVNPSIIINLSPEKLKQTETVNVASSDLNLSKSSDLAEINRSSTVEPTTELKSDNINNSQNPANVDQPSKYQYHKLFTKKAWLKNYDLEDQARLNGEIATKPLVATKAAIKSEVDPDQATKEMDLIEPKPINQNSKSNGSARNAKTKVDSKKKTKEGRPKKASSVSALKTTKSATTTKNNENDSEGTNSSTSDPDDTDETDSLKSTNDKKLRRMPKRKVKLNSDRESSDQSNHQTKTKSSKDGLDKDNVAKGRSKKDHSNSNPETSCPTKRKYNSDDESAKQKTKKVRESVNKAPEKSDSLPISKSKPKVGEKFLQTQSCFEIVAKSIRCLECRKVRQSSVKGDKANWGNFCRFLEFRKLRFNKSAQVVVAGFSEAGDAKESDMQLWLPSEVGNKPSNMSFKVAKFILANIGDEFCKLVSQERAVLNSYEAEAGDKKVIWRRAVEAVRELCDVCSTTLFNYHYVCDRCGVLICIDCHKTRAQVSNDADTDGLSVKNEIDDAKLNCENNHGDAEQVTVSNKKSKKDSHGWMFCAKNEEHSPSKLTLTKIIAGNCLEEVWTMLHEIRAKLGLGQCYCKNSIKPTDVRTEKFDENINESINIKQEVGDESVGSHSTLKGLLLASNDSSINISSDIKQQADVNVGTQDSGIRTTANNTFDDTSDDRELDFGSEDDSRQVSAAIEGCIASLAADGSDDIDVKSKKQDTCLNDATAISSRLCDGDLLVLTEAGQKDNTKLFRGHWRHGKPVLVRGIHNRMTIDMWLPQFFLGKFGDYRSDLVDCRNGDIHRQSMRKYWDGFEPSSSKKKPKEDSVPGHIPPANNEEPSAISTSYYSGSALWRLKDWPPGQDFNEILPEHYNDFMNNLPLKSYTTRTGGLNLASRLPNEMLKPDLGPKMYSAYGTTKFPERGTTNLHLDISDAVNVLVYVGGAMPFKHSSSEYSEIYESTISECRVDSAMKDQIRQNKLIPGALWHIFKPSDVPKIREFLNKMSDECKISVEKRIDPIHDQTWYLDQNLLDRLEKEYGVRSYPILQCMGDAILIPAGSPHQVKNLQNCIKVANDFVSPENIRSCLQLTREFRNLPETHINQEDKLQIKNIMYHSVKESIQYIKMFESGRVNLQDESSDEDDDPDDH